VLSLSHTRPTFCMNWGITYGMCVGIRHHAVAKSPNSQSLSLVLGGGWLVAKRMICNSNCNTGCNGSLPVIHGLSIGNPYHPKSMFRRLRYVWHGWKAEDETLSKKNILVEVAKRGTLPETGLRRKTRKISRDRPIHTQTEAQHAVAFLVLRLKIIFK
jgi:hypothetical protein